MTREAKGDFEVTSWSEEPAPGLEGTSKVTVARIGQRYTGDIEADTVSDLVMTYREDGTADYLGFQRVLGHFDGRKGSFVLQATGTFDGGEATTTLSVVPGSGKGDLAGLSGTGTAVAPQGSTGTYTLECDFG
jgi:hypothetical protein